jgi:hypothetical protein
VPVVREELGPSLPQLLEPRWRVLSRGRRIALVAAAALLLLALVAAREVLRDDPLKVLVVKEPIAFNLVHRAELEEVTPKPGELTRLQSGATVKTDERFVVRPLQLPAYKGDVSSAYLTLASRRLAQLKAADPDVGYRGEGKARINLIPGYQLAYQTRKAGKLYFGKIFFLAPEPGDGEEQTTDGVELDLLSQFSPSTTPNLTDVGNTYLLKAPLRSFRFGTERP